MNSDRARSVAFDPRAPEDERRDAQTELVKASTPSSVDGGALALVKWVREQWDEYEFSKSLQADHGIANPSYSVQHGRPGMQSVWFDDTQIVMQSGQWRDRPGGLQFDTMRTMVQNTPVLSAIVNTRVRQVARFCHPNRKAGRGEGFSIVLRDPDAQPTEAQKKRIIEIQDFFSNSGTERKARRRQQLKRDNFTGLMSKLVRDSLTMDMAPIELEWRRDKSMGLDGMYAVDGSTIRLVSEAGYDGDDEICAIQLVNGQVRAKYSYEDIVLTPRNPRSDVIAAGYGLSEVEQLVRVVTAYLNMLTYNTSYFDQNSIPRGVLHLSGNYSDADLSAFKRYMKAMLTGAGKHFQMPVMVSKDQESKASYEKFDEGENEMMFSKFASFLTSICCAIFGMDPSEISFDSFSAGTSSLSGSDTEQKIALSKDKGLRPLLSYFESTFSEFIVPEFGDDFAFHFTGLDDEDQEQIFERQKLMMTVNELRALDNLDEITDPWGDAPLNPSLMSAWQMSQQQGQEDYGQPGDPQQVGAPGEDGQPGDGQDFGQQPQDGEQQDGQDFGQAEQGQPGADAPPGGQQPDADTIAKAFGLPALPIYGIDS